MNQRGFIQGAALYAVLGLGAATLLASGYGWVQGVRLDAVKAELKAVTVEYSSCLASVDRQNKAVAELELKGKQAQERVRAAQAASEASKRASGVEIARLKAVKPSGSSCAAQQAVQRVREGLR